MASLALRLALLLLPSAALGARNGHCPPLGPVLPAPTSPSTSDAVQSAAARVADYFAANVTAGINGSAVSLGARSVHETGANLLDLHFTPPTLNASGATTVDASTAYRVGSVSKIFTAYGVMLAAGVRLDDLVVDYLPELKQMAGEPGEAVTDITAVDWDEVTIEALMSHTAGIASELPFDLTIEPEDWAAYGFPTVDVDAVPAEEPGCAGVFGLQPCNRTEFFRDFGKRHPVYAPFSQVVYSNVDFYLLGFVLEAVSNMTLETYLAQTVLAPLGLNRTGLAAPPAPESGNFIPLADVNTSWYGSELGYISAAGGVYTSSDDLLRLGASILSHELLSAGRTRKWLRPRMSTSSPGTQMGTPWEIYRSTELTADGRLIELYTKSGDVGLYHTELVLVPDYDVVLAVLLGGDEFTASSAGQIMSDVLSILIPALEQAGKDAAQDAMVGTYSTTTSDASNTTTTTTSITLSVDDSPGLAVSNWTVRGVDVTAVAAALDGVTDAADVRARMYPTNLAAGAQRAWRVVFDTGTAAQLAADDARYAWPGGSCETWATVDRSAYSFRSFDDLVVTLASDGKARSIDMRGFQVNVTRT